MTIKLPERAFEHGRITEIGPSDGRGGEIAPEFVKIGFSRREFNGYLENVGLIATVAISGGALVLIDPRLAFRRR